MYFYPGSSRSLIARVKGSPVLVKLIGLLVLSGLCCMLALMATCTGPYGLDDLRAQVFARQIFAYPLPPNTEVVAQYAHMGAPSAGRVCYYSVAQLLSTRLSRAEVERYYQGAQFSVPLGGAPDLRRFDLQWAASG